MSERRNTFVNASGVIGNPCSAVRPPNVSTRWLGSGNVVSKWPSRPASSSGCGEFPGKRAMLTVPMPTLTRKPSVRPLDVRARTRAFARIRSWSFLPSFILVLGVFHKNSTWTADFQFLNPGLYSFFYVDWRAVDCRSSAGRESLIQ